MKKFVTTWAHDPATQQADRRAAMERLATAGATPQEIAAAEVTAFVDDRSSKRTGPVAPVESRRMVAVRA